jgi:hypothetical protein
VRATWLAVLALSACGLRGTPAPGPRGEEPVSRKTVAACDAVARLIDRTPGIELARIEGLFEDPFSQRLLEGCRILVSGSFAALAEQPGPDDVLHEELTAEGWTEDTDYSADGPDGTIFAFRRDGTFCLIEGRWEGGVVQDHVPPSDRYELTVGCSD